MASARVGLARQRFTHQLHRLQAGWWSSSVLIPFSPDVYAIIKRDLPAMWRRIFESAAPAEGCGKRVECGRPMRFWVDRYRFPRVEARTSLRRSGAAVAPIGRHQVLHEALYCSVRYSLIQPPRIHYPSIHLQKALPYCFMLLSLHEEFTWISDPFCFSFIMQKL